MGKEKYSRGKEALVTGNWACPAPWAHSPDPQSHLTQGHPSMGTVDSMQVRPSTVWSVGDPLELMKPSTDLTTFTSVALHMGATI